MKRQYGPLVGIVRQDGVQPLRLVFELFIRVQRNKARPLKVEPVCGFAESIGAILRKRELWLPVNGESTSIGFTNATEFMVAWCRDTGNRSMNETARIKPFAPLRIALGPIDQIARMYEK